MGSVNGSITLWDVTTAEVSKILENGHTAAVTALTWSSSRGLFSAAEDRQIVEWNVQESGIKCKWKSGKSKVTALVVSEDGKSLLSADRNIKWWDLSTKRLIASFTGHANQVTFLRTVRLDDNSYVISGATGEGYLSVWALEEVYFFALFLHKYDPVNTKLFFVENLTLDNEISSRHEDFGIKIDEIHSENNENVFFFYCFRDSSGTSNSLHKIDTLNIKLINCSSNECHFATNLFLRTTITFFFSIVSALQAGKERPRRGSNIDDAGRCDFRIG